MLRRGVMPRSVVRQTRSGGMEAGVEVYIFVIVQD